MRYIVHIHDDVDERVAGQRRCSYRSPPQPRAQALGLAGIVLARPQPALAGDGPWQTAIAGGRRTVELVPDGDGDGRR